MLITPNTSIFNRFDLDEARWSNVGLENESFLPLGLTFRKFKFTFALCCSPVQHLKTERYVIVCRGLRARIRYCVCIATNRCS